MTFGTNDLALIVIALVGAVLGQGAAVGVQTATNGKNS